MSEENVSQVGHRKKELSKQNLRALIEAKRTNGLADKSSLLITAVSPETTLFMLKNLINTKVGPANIEYSAWSKLRQKEIWLKKRHYALFAVNNKRIVTIDYLIQYASVLLELKRFFVVEYLYEEDFFLQRSCVSPIELNQTSFQWQLYKLIC